MQYQGLFQQLRGPLIASIDVTGACNFKCLHCYNNSGCKWEDELSDDEVYDAAKQIAEFKCYTVCLCGGEPMLRGNLLNLIECLAPNTGFVNMVSNGSLIKKTTTDSLKNAGLNTLQISLDGINALQHDTFRGYVGAFDKAVKAIQYAKTSGLTVVTSFIPNKLNYRSVEKYIDFCIELGVDSVRFMPLIPMGRGSRLDSLLLSPEDYIDFQLKLEFKKQKYKNCKQQIEWGDPLDHFVRMPKNVDLGLKTFSMEVKANGNIAISTYIPIYIGNIREHTLKYYWENGYNNVWGNHKVLDYISNIETIYDINRLDPKPYEGEFMLIDL